MTQIKNVYGLKGDGTKIFLGTKAVAVDVGSPVGGRIFYIDETSDEEVQFFDVNGALIESVSVGDMPFYYKVTNPGTSGKDKYYIYYEWSRNYPRFKSNWTYYNSQTSSWVDELLDCTQESIGSGRQNTLNIMSYDSGAYIKNSTTEKPTIWSILKKVNEAKEFNCNDWYVPSSSELYALRGFIQTHIGDGIIDFMYESYFYSSSEVSSTDCKVVSYGYINQQNSKHSGSSYKFILIRSF